MTFMEYTKRIGRVFLINLSELRTKREERLNTSLSAIRSAEKARLLAGRITEAKEKGTER